MTEIKPTTSMQVKIKDFPEFTIYATKQLLIPLDDKFYDHNTYGEYCKLIARVQTATLYIEHSKYMRFESSIILDGELSQLHFDTFKQQIEDYLLSVPFNGVEIHKFASSIKFDFKKNDSKA